MRLQQRYGCALTSKISGERSEVRCIDRLGLFNGENMKKTDWLPCNEAPPIREGYYEVRLWEEMCIPSNHGRVMRFYFDGKRWRNRHDGHRLVVEDRPGWHKKDEWRGVERPNV